MTRIAALLIVAAALGSPPAPAETGSPAPPIPVPVAEPAVTMHMLLEKTIFQVDVLTLDLWLGPETVRQLEPLLPLTSQSDADAAALIALQSRDARARIEFRRDFGLGRFLEGIDDDMRRARDAGFLTAAGYDTVATGLPRYFAPLAERGIKADDRLYYRVHGDTLRTVFQRGDGRIVIDQTDVGPERRLSLLGSFFVRGSGFRRGLLASLPHKATD
jgi:hypothetical protein